MAAVSLEDLIPLGAAAVIWYWMFSRDRSRCLLCITIVMVIAALYNLALNNVWGAGGTRAFEYSAVGAIIAAASSIMYQHTCDRWLRTHGMPSLCKFQKRTPLAMPLLGLSMVRFSMESTDTLIDLLSVVSIAMLFQTIRSKSARRHKKFALCWQSINVLCMGLDGQVASATTCLIHSIVLAFVYHRMTEQEKGEQAAAMRTQVAFLRKELRKARSTVRRVSSTSSADSRGGDDSSRSEDSLQHKTARDRWKLADRVVRRQSHALQRMQSWLSLNTAQMRRLSYGLTAASIATLIVAIDVMINRRWEQQPEANESRATGGEALVIIAKHMAALTEPRLGGALDWFTVFMVQIYRVSSSPEGRSDSVRPPLGLMSPQLIRPKGELDDDTCAWSGTCMHTVWHVPLHENASETAKADHLRVPASSVEDFVPPADEGVGAKLGAWVKELLKENLHKLDMALSHTIDNRSRFADDEDPVGFIRSKLEDIYPKAVENWHDKLSDAALTRFAFFGIGAHRIEPLLHEGASGLGGRGAKHYILRTNQLADLAVRPGFDTYGGDAIFDSQWRVVRIDRKENGTLVSYYPGDEPRWGYAKFCFRSSVFTLVTVIDHLYDVHLVQSNGFVKASKATLSGSHPLRRFLAPFLFQTVTVNDNARAFLISEGGFGPRNFALTAESMRAVWAGAHDLAGAQSLPYFVGLRERSPATFERIASSTRERYRHMKSVGVDVPYFSQGAELAGLFSTFFDGFMRIYYPRPEDLVADSEALAFLSALMDWTEGVGLRDSLRSAAPKLSRQLRHDLKRCALADDAPSWSSSAEEQDAGSVSSSGSGAAIAVSCLDGRVASKWLQQKMTRLMETVTMVHRHVGTVSEYGQDARFCAFAWPRGEATGTRQTAIRQAALTSFTSMAQPKLMVAPGSDGDWTRLWPSNALDGTPLPQQSLSALRKVFYEFQRGLAELSEKIESDNDAASARRFPHNHTFHAINPRHLDTSVSV